MKPKINLDDPLVKYGMSVINNSGRIVLDVPDKVGDALVPILAILKTKAHQRPKTKPEQIGSGVLVKIEDQYFIFSATHVFWHFEQNAIIIGNEKSGFTEELTGERFSSGKIDSPQK